MRRGKANLLALIVSVGFAAPACVDPVHDKAVEDRLNPNEGFWWNGTASEGWGARHLGLIQVPPVGTTQAGVVGMMGDALFTGSGFGHALAVNDAAMIWVYHDTTPHALSSKIKSYTQAQSWFQDIGLVGV